MVILIKRFKGSVHADKFNRLYRAKTTCVIRSTPSGERYFLPDEVEVSKSTVLELIKEKRFL